MVASSPVTFRWDVSTAKYPDDDLRRFSEAHADSLSPARGLDGVLYCLPLEHIESCLRLFRLDQVPAEAERDLAELCEVHDAIGICDAQFISYRLLRPPLPWPPKCDLRAFLQLGWTAEVVDQVQTLSDPTAKLIQRLRGSAGRLVSMPMFLNAKADLRRQWEELPRETRPPMPIARSSKTSPPPVAIKPAPSAVADFIGWFDRFCDAWALQGLVTWELPDVSGPLLAAGMAPLQESHQGELSIRVPWHFAIIAEDGLGPLLQDEHRRQSAEHGVDDSYCWETYARLLEVYHWENLLLNRYSRRERLKGFVTAMESLMGEIIGLSCERVQTLRKRLHALQDGRRKSLRGLR